MSVSSGQTDICYLLNTFFFSTEEIRVFTLYSQRFWGGFTPRAFTRSSSVRMALRWLLLSMVYGALENSSSVRVKSNLGGGVEANFLVRTPPYQHKYTLWAWGKAPNIWSNMTNSKQVKAYYLPGTLWKHFAISSLTHLPILQGRCYHVHFVGEKTGLDK